MKNRLKLKTLDSRIYIIFTTLIFIMILSMQVVSYYSASSSIKSSALDTNRTLLNRLVTQLDSYISDMDLIIEILKDEDGVDQLLMLDTDEWDEQLQLEIENRFHTFHKARQDIYSIALFAFNGRIILDSGLESLNEYAKFEETPWYRGAIEKDGEPYLSSSYVQNTIKGKYSWVVSMSKEIKDLGIMLIDLRFNRIQQLCNSLTPGKKGYIFIVDQLGNYIYHPSQQLVYSGIKREPIQTILRTDTLNEDGRNYLSMTSELSKWRVCSVSFDDEIMDSWRNVQYYYVLIGLIAFLIVGFATTFISQSITKPVRYLCDTMKTVETGEFRPIGNIKATSEIQELAYEYNIMIGKINELMQTIVTEQESKRKSDLKALQAQINPHFLYNTLDSIIWMGEMNHSEDVVRMTSALSKLFRISISRGKEIISLKDEIHHVTSYLTIQEMRYKDKFSYTIDIDEEILQCKTLKITLQPLVENAIYHGIKSVDYEGLIEITGRKVGNQIILRVSDNGKGMNKEELDSILNQNSASTKQGTGVKNVHERVRLYFGEEYGLQCTSIVGKGTEISVNIPIIEDEELPL